MDQNIAYSAYKRPADSGVKRWGMLLGMLLLLGAPLNACSLCMGTGARQSTMAEEIIGAQDVVLARKSARGGFAVQSVIKGNAALKGTTITIPDAARNGVLVATRTQPASPWTSQGAFAIYLQPFLRTVQAWPVGEPSSDTEWTHRLQSARPFLAHADLRIANSAWAIWARAPRQVIKAQAATVPLEDLRQWLAEPANPQQHGLWLTLLGFCGNSGDADWIEQRVRTAADNHDESSLAALLAAFIEQRGENAIRLVEQRYLSPREQTMGETRAALAAFSLQGREGSPAIRARIIRSFRDFVEERPAWAGFIGRDLADWQQWDLVPKFNELRYSKSIHPSATLGVLEFLYAWERKSP